MIKHVVMWRLKDDVEGRSKYESAKLMQQKLEALKGKIPEIIDLYVLINSEEASDQNFDIMLYSEFENFDKLEVYQKHPDHVEVGKFVKTVAYERACIDS